MHETPPPPFQWNYTAVSEGCRKQYGVTPRPMWIQTLYGGKDITAASNIVFRLVHVCHVPYSLSLLTTATACWTPGQEVE